jgi:hypothetical protein
MVPVATPVASNKVATTKATAVEGAATAETSPTTETTTAVAASTPTVPGRPPWMSERDRGEPY